MLESFCGKENVRFELNAFGAVFEYVFQYTQLEPNMSRFSKFFQYFAVEGGFGGLAWVYPSGRQSVGFGWVERFGVKPDAVLGSGCDNNNLAACFADAGSHVFEERLACWDF